MLYIPFFSVETVTKGILELITDTSKSSSVLRVTAKRGLTYHVFKEDMPRSKL